MADEINERHHDGRENRGRGEGRDEQGERGEQTTFEIDDRDARKQTGVEDGGADGAQRVRHLLRRRAAHLARGFAEDCLFANRQHEKKKRAHGDDADREQEKHAEKFAEQIFDSRNRLRQDRVDRAVVDVLRQQARGRDHGEQRREDAHRAERDIFQHLEFLLERHLGHEDRAADQEQREEQQDVENFQPRQLGQSIAGDGGDAPERESAVRRPVHGTSRASLSPESHQEKRVPMKPWAARDRSVARRVARRRL